MIDLTEKHLELVQNLLAVNIPGAQVRAFGSRVSGCAKTFSDLDLVVMNDLQFTDEQFANAAFAFDESDLPVRVDLARWSELPPSICQAIEANHAVVHLPQKESTHYV